MAGSNAPDTFGGRLRRARLAAGLSQSDLSEKIGIPKPTLSRYENDHVLPALTTLARLAEGLKVRESTLLHHPPDVLTYFGEALGRRGVRISSTAEADRIADAVAELMSRESRPARRAKRSR